MKLLVAEKDPMVRHLLGAQAATLGIQMTFTQNSAETWHALAHDAPDCVILDASTSSQDDAPLWHQLRQHPSTQRLPVLIYSSSQRWQRVAELAASQVDGYLPLPFTTETLLSEARRIAHQRRAQA